MIAALTDCLDHALMYLRQQVADLSDQDFVLQPPGASNHAAWTFGHIIYSFQEMTVELGGAAWLPPDWESRFAYGSIPCPETVESGKSTMLAALDSAASRLRTVVMAMDAEKLESPPRDAEARTLFPTQGHLLLQVIVAHTAFHAGQLAGWRRAIGRAPAGVFI